MPRGRSFGGGVKRGGRFPSRHELDEDHLKYAVSAAAGVAAGAAAADAAAGGGTSISGSIEDLPLHDYYMDMMPLARRCQLFMNSLAQSLKFGKYLHISEVLRFNTYLVGCPDTPDLKKLYDSGEKETRARKQQRCNILLHERARVLTEQNQELTASQIVFFKTWLDDCPNAAAVLHGDSQ